MDRNQEPTLVVLAAGMGSRYGGLKQMDRFGPNGENIIDYSIYDAVQAGFGKVVFVIREKFRDDFVEFFSGKFDHLIDVEYVPQELDMIPDGFTVPAGREKPWGTGHAVLVTRGVVDTPFAVINADDFYGRDAYFKIRDFFRSQDEERDYCVVGYYLRNTLSEHGPVNRGVCHVDAEMHLERVEEITKIERDSDGVIRYPAADNKKEILPDDSIVSMNIWGFFPSFFRFAEEEMRKFLALQGMAPSGELYIPTIVDALINRGVMAVKVLTSDSEWFGVTYKDDKPFVSRQIKALIEKGEYPRDLWG